MTVWVDIGLIVVHAWGRLGKSLKVSTRWVYWIIVPREDIRSPQQPVCDVSRPFATLLLCLWLEGNPVDERERSSAVPPGSRNNVVKRHSQVSTHLFTTSNQWNFRWGDFKCAPCIVLISHESSLPLLREETSDAPLLGHCSALTEWEPLMHSNTSNCFTPRVWQAAFGCFKLDFSSKTA